MANPEWTEIVVNGLTKKVTGNEITFAKVVELAFDKPPGDVKGLTVTYRGKTRGGSMLAIAAEPVLLEEGMVFNVANTSNA